MCKKLLQFVILTCQFSMLDFHSPLQKKETCLHIALACLFRSFFKNLVFRLLCCTVYICLKIFVSATALLFVCSKAGR